MVRRKQGLGAKPYQSYILLHGLVQLGTYQVIFFVFFHLNTEISTKSFPLVLLLMSKSN